MEKIIRLSANGQTLTADKMETVNATVGLIYCEFQFDASWDNYPAKLANFKRENQPMSEAVTATIVNNRCRVPDELLRYKGCISVAVQGENTEGQTERTAPAHIIMQTQTITDGRNAIDPSPDQYAEFIERAGEAIEEYFDEHKSEFKGDPGEPGAPGEPGDDYILTESDREEIAGIAVEDISPVLAKKVERIRLTCDDSHIYLDEVQQTYEQVLAMVQDPTKYVTLLYAECISLQPHGWDGAAVYFMSSYINDGTAYIDRFIINYQDQGKFTETTLALGDDLAELQGEVSSVRESLDDKVGFTDYASASKGGVVKTSNTYGAQTSANGYLQATTKTLDAYNSTANTTIIGKGTLENVLAERLKEPQFELIEEITLTSSISSFKRESEPNGNPYNFKKLAIYIECSNAGNQITVIPYVNNKMVGYSMPITVGSNSKALAHYDTNGGILVNYHWASSLTNGNSATPIYGATNINNMLINNINSIEWKSFSNVLPSGTVIKIYGVRA